MTFEIDQEREGRPVIHVAIVRRVRPGHEVEFERALRQFFHDTLDDPSTSGASFIRPEPGDGANEYGILRSFSDDRARQRFYTSPAYRRWSEQVAPLVEGEPKHDAIRGLEGFFRAHGVVAPPPWKMAVVTWLAVNPAVWIWSTVVPSVLGDLPKIVAFTLVNTLVVVTLTWVFMPALVRTLRRWLS